MSEQTNPAEATATTAADAIKPEGVDNVVIAAHFKAEGEASQRRRADFLNTWKRNVQDRLGIASTAASTGLFNETQSEINPDWSLTKTKTANLYSQVPRVQGEHLMKKYAPAIFPFMKQLNYEISDRRGHVAVAMEESLNDTVNASGIAGVLVEYAARFDQVEIPAQDIITLPQTDPMQPPQQLAVKDIPPDAIEQMIAAKTIPTRMVDRVISDMFSITRLSPTELLTPDGFLGSNFDDGDWVGHDGSMSWAEALVAYPVLKPEDKDAVMGASGHPEMLSSDSDKVRQSQMQKVRYRQIFYWRYKVDPNEKSFKAIWRLVYVKGKEAPVIHEPWKGQQYDPKTRKYVGVCRFPLRFLTLTYVTDNPIPPSDTEAGRPHVQDLRRSRSQMFESREHSIPVRGFDTNRVDPETRDLLTKGRIQGFIPFNGNAQNAIWETARASYPAENHEFDVNTMGDLMRSWQIGPNQVGMEMGSRTTGTESGIVQANFATRIGQERAKVANFFLGICEVVAGLMALYSDFSILSDEERQTMQVAWDQKHILHDLVLKILPDSTIMLDTNSQLERDYKFLSMTAKSGYVNVKPVITSIAQLSGKDPADVITDPPPPSEDPNISYRFSGKDDLMNVGVMAMLVEKKQAPSPESVRAAIEILKAVQSGIVPQANGMPPMPKEPAPGEDMHPEFALSNRVAKRSRDMNTGE